MNSDDAHLRHVHVSAAQQQFCFDAHLIPGQHNDGSPSRVWLLGGSQCLQPSSRIVAQNTRKLPHPAWGPNPKRTGRRQQEWASKQRILATRCHGRFFVRKTAEWPRNEPGMFQKGPGTKLASPLRKIAAHQITASDLKTFTNTFLINMRMKLVMTTT